jgi:16S rRNA (cytosine967-C5)-methyltransferase
VRTLHPQQSAELLDTILTGTMPADAQMERYFRAHPNMGVRDRGEVAETVYACLRERRVLAHIAGSDTDTRGIVLACLLRQGHSARALEPLAPDSDIRTLAGRARTLDSSALPVAVRANLPDWLAERLELQIGAEAMLALAESLNRPAPVDLRINTFKGDRETVRERLASEGHPAEPTPYAPDGLRRLERTPLFRTQCFRDGLFEIQDEGSQLISLLLEPRRYEMVVDFCAGAGGKTLHLGALMANTGTLYAFDTSAARLERLKPRLRRSGLQNVRSVLIAHERDARVVRLQGKIDRVLVDAPCSGTGTLRRNPDIKWRPIDLERLVAEQQRILTAAATLVKPGGRLVYATCSLLREENDGVTGTFLAAHPQFRTVPVTEILVRRHIPLAMADPALRLSPLAHGTDGFYALVLERTA